MSWLQVVVDNANNKSKSRHNITWLQVVVDNVKNKSKSQYVLATSSRRQCYQ